MPEILALEDMDRRDREILFELDSDSRQPYARIAKKLRMSKENVKYRVNRLLELGLIDSFYAFSDLPQMGFQFFKAYVRLGGAGRAKEEEYFAFLRSHPKVVYSARCVGRYDSLFNALVRDPEEFNELLHEIQQRFGKEIRALDVATDTMQVRVPRRYLVGRRASAERSAPKLSKDELSEIDLRMISLLSANSRAPVEELAKKCGISGVTA
ncbi:MAG: AsnC family transcriptional regulator, partial [Candidatus Micrarchaeota archaeon]